MIIGCFFLLLEYSRKNDIYLAVATSQQHLYMEYLSLSSSNISELDFIDRGLLLQKATEPKVPIVQAGSYPFESFTDATMTWLTVTEYLCHKWPWICSICRKQFPLLFHSWSLTRFVTRLTQQVKLVEQELFIHPEHLSSPPLLVRFMLFDL